jgi:hypothetical protein
LVELACAAGGARQLRYSGRQRAARDRDGPDQQQPRERFSMNVHLTIGPVVALIAGILILVIPRLLNYIVALYLIIIGLLGIFG